MGPPWVRNDLVFQSLYISFLLGEVCNLRNPPPPPCPLSSLGSPITAPPFQSLASWACLILGGPQPPQFPAAPSRSPAHQPVRALHGVSDCPPRRQQRSSTRGCHFHSRCGEQWGQPRLPGKSGGQIGWPALSGVPGPLSVIFPLDTPAPPPRGFSLRARALPASLCS